MKEGKKKTIEKLLRELMSRIPARKKRHSTWGMFGGIDNKIGLSEKQREFKEAFRRIMVEHAWRNVA